MSAIKSNSLHLKLIAATTFANFQFLLKNNRLVLKHTQRIQSYKRDTLRFFLFDQYFLTNFYSEYTPNNFIFFLTSFFKKLLIKPLYNESQLIAAQPHGNSNAGFSQFSIFSLFFRLNTAVFLFTAYKHLQAYKFFFLKLLKASIHSILKVFSFSTNTFTLPVDFLSQATSFLTFRISKLIVASKLAPTNLIKLVIFFLTEYLNDTLIGDEDDVEIPDSSPLKPTSIKFLAYKLKNLRLNSRLLQVTARKDLNRAAPVSFETKTNFFANYLKIRTKFLKEFSSYVKNRRTRKYSFSVKRKSKKIIDRRKVK